ncbi:YcaO-like family protein [Micromonospora gifhornensis]|uniref:YcaO-like family protein n=1 Tax=Micromonospora gifhornensis TaxID=84594 RepID=UPI003452C1DF
MLSTAVEAGTDKTYRDGTDRAIAPAETWQRVLPRLPEMGITRVADVTGLDHIGVPVFMAVRPNSRGLTVAQGKGLSVDAARVSAVMESIEAYHAERIEAPLLLGSWDELARHRRLVDTSFLITAAGEPLRRDRRLLWIEGTDLMSGEPVWLPFDLVHNDYTGASQAGQSPFAVTSNGLASGNHLLEATSHAICEVIERDAEALWLATPKQRQDELRVDPDTVDDPACRYVLDTLAAAGVAAACWDMTTDIGLPCFTVDIAEDPRVSISRVAVAQGQGCHPRREIALLRALTEAVQSRLTVIAGSRDDFYRSLYARANDLDNREAAWRTCAAGNAPRHFTDVPTRDNASFQEDIEHELAALRQAGITEAIQVPLGGEQLGISVVRVMLPGAEHAPTPDTYHPGPRARRLREAGA